MKKIVLAMFMGVLTTGALWAADYSEGGLDTCNSSSFNYCNYQDCWYSYSYSDSDHSGYCAWNPNGNNNKGECDCVVD